MQSPHCSFEIDVYMTSTLDQDQTPITSLNQLADYLALGCKPIEEWRIGTEHEKFGFNLIPDRENYLLSPPYSPHGIKEILSQLQDLHPHWQGVYDEENLIGLIADYGAISLEPAGQFELSGAAVANLHETKREMLSHFKDIHSVVDPLHLAFAPLGFHPFAKREQMPWMPKRRYKIMKAYMPKVGKLGLDMMTRTCTVQVNLDFASQEDMARKMRVSLALQPLATALFANSPFYEGKPCEYQSMRSFVWTDTDNQRCGMPECIFASDFGFENYVEWLLDVPMYFVMRGDKMIDVAGASFRDWLKGNPPDGIKDKAPTMGDFKNHVTVAFSDVRLKQYIEMRGADAGSPEMMMALSAFWTGLLYDPNCLLEVESLVKQHPWSAYVQLRPQVCKNGLSVKLGNENLRAFGKKILQLALEGLQKRKQLNEKNEDEQIYLAPLQAIVDGAPNQAEQWLHRYQTAWNGDLSHIVQEARI